MENNETLLTNELYESIMQNLIKEVVDLKKSQSDTISRLAIQIETLKALKKDIRITRRKIRENKSNLRTINEELSKKNHIVSDLNYSFITEGDSYIDLEVFPNLEVAAKKR